MKKVTTGNAETMLAFMVYTYFFENKGNLHDDNVKSVQTSQGKQIVKLANGQTYVISIDLLS